MKITAANDNNAVMIKIGKLIQTGLMSFSRIENKKKTYEYTGIIIYQEQLFEKYMIYMLIINNFF